MPRPWITRWAFIQSRRADLSATTEADESRCWRRRKERYSAEELALARTEGYQL